MFYRFGLVLGITVLALSAVIQAEAAPRVRLFVSVLNGFNQIYELDPDTGAVLNSFAAPEPLTGDDGLAYDGTTLWVFSDNGTTSEINIFGIDPTTGEVLETHTLQRPMNGVFTGMATQNGLLFILDRMNHSIHKYNPGDGSVDIIALGLDAPPGGGLGAVNPLLIGLIISDLSLQTITIPKFLTEINAIVFDMDPFFAPIATIPGILGGIDGADPWIFAASSADNTQILVKFRTDGTDMTPLDHDFTDPFSGVGAGFDGDDDDDGNIGDAKMVDAKLLEGPGQPIKITNILDLTGDGFVYIAICSKRNKKGKILFDTSTTKFKDLTLRDSKEGSVGVPEGGGSSLKHVNDDGIKDLVIRFSKKQLLAAGVNAETTSLKLEGKLEDGTPIEATIEVKEVKVK